MKIPEPAPGWLEQVKKGIGEVFSHPDQQLVANLITKANEEYVYWDKLKHFAIPEGLTPELMWSYLKLTRFNQMKRTPIKDKNKPVNG